MAPAPQDLAHGPLIGPSGPLKGDEVVISGISGIFPSSENTSQFKENLFNKVDMVTKDDLGFDHPQAPKYLGKINGVNKFDAQFFRINYHQATAMEPMSRKLLEEVYSAMYDSGINPLAYKGRKVGVFIGTSYTDFSNYAMYHVNRTKGLRLSGFAKSMFANRVSYWIDAKGPSFALDCSCTSSMVCLEHAYSSMIRGECEAAIVGGCNLCVHPILGLNMRSAGHVSLDGKTRCFDKNADGFVRAEAISVVFLQKAKDAKRIYAQVCHANVTYGLRDDAEFLTLRKADEIESYLKDFYSQVDVSPKQVEYVEANGTATPEADKHELEAIGNIFAKDNVVKVGCVKSNMGNSEPASGLCALTKVCLAYHEGKIPANLHYTDPLDQVAPLQEGKLHIVNETEPFKRGYSAVNNFSCTGTNCHVLLKGHYKKKERERYKCNVPKLVTVSGRHEESVEKILKYIKNKPIDPEEIGMFHNIYKIETPFHMGRGYTIVDTNENNETICLAQNVEYFPGGKRPLWLVFSGMGSQWPGMAADLMKIPTFNKAIQKCHETLLPKGLDLIKIITEPDKNMFDKILHSFVGIAAVQIGLTDVLKDIGIVPDNYIGHSQGEMCCAYFDNCFTIEEMILAAYSRGIVSMKTEFIRGSMAAVGMGYEDLLPIIPPEIDIACHNSAESATISGPEHIVNKFVEELTAKGVFARPVACSNIAFHSRYIAHAGKVFTERLRSFVKESKPRSEKWICTSIPQERWDEPLAKTSSPEFHTNNLMSPVYFEEAARLIPDNAVVVEVAPHGLLQAVLKRSHPECIHIPLTKRGTTDQVKFLLEAIGKIYQQGYDVNLETLYPKIEYPVGTETPLLSHLIEWEHSEEWPEISNNQNKRITTSAREVTISLNDDDYNYMTGFIRDGKYVLSESAIIFLVWETLATFKGVNFKNMSVTFNEIQFHGEAILKYEEILKINIMINKGNDRFEVSHNKTLLASGTIVEVSKPKYDVMKEDNILKPEDLIINSSDIYSILHTKGLTYRNEFQSITSFNTAQKLANIKWNNNWIIFLDSLIQLNLLTRDYDGICAPKLIKKLTINTDINLLEQQKVKSGEIHFEAKQYEVYNVTRCAGVEIRHIIFNENIPKEQYPDALETLSFVPHFVPNEVSFDVALRVCLQIMADNISDHVINAIEVNNTSVLAPVINELVDTHPELNIKMKIATAKGLEVDTLDKTNQIHLVIIQHLLHDEKKIMNIMNKIDGNTFVLTLENNNQEFSKHKLLNIICSMPTKDFSLILMKKAEDRDDDDADDDAVYIDVDNEDRFSWVPRLQNKLQESKRIVLVSERQPHSGLLGFVRKVKKSYKKPISLVTIEDYHAPTFNYEKSLFKEQLQKDLTFNVFKKGQWGSYYYVPISITTYAENFALTIGLPGDINTLEWKERAQSDNKNLVNVSYAGPSVKDVQKAVGLIESEDNVFGMDFSGVDSNGNKVMGLLPEGAISNVVQPDPYLVWPVPNHWSLEEAATVPLPYVHAYYALVCQHQLLKGQRIFVNGGTGALGQAVISIALSLNCTVYTSVSTLNKKQLLLRLFPQLEEKNIGYTRDGCFHTMVMVNSGYKGCHFVVNSESGISRTYAMKCVGMFGIFIDVNSYNMKKNKDFTMSYLEKDRSYKSLQLRSLFKPEYLEERKILQFVIAEGIAKGVIRPTTRVVYPCNDINRAFRLISNNSHRGRVLINMRDSNAHARKTCALPRVAFSSKRSYVIICDETNLGIDLADRLVKRGARNLILNVRSKFVTGYLQFKLANWNKYAVAVKVSSENLEAEENCLALLKESELSGQIEGIFIIQDSKDQSELLSREALQETADRTISVIANLDLLSRNNCPVLSDFVVLVRSSHNAINEYASSASQKICQARSEASLPAMCFRIEHLDELNETLPTNSKLVPQSISTAFNAMEISLKQKYDNVLTYNFKKNLSTVFYQKLAQSLGVHSLDNIDENLAVNDFIVNEINIEEIRTAIKITCGIDYHTETVKNMTIARLKNLNKNVDVRQNTKLESGFSAFFSLLDPDEYEATQVIVPMRTIVNATKVEEYNYKATHLMLIPGFEGNHKIFKSMCERLKIRAATLQLGPDVANESIPAMAAHLLKFLKKSFQAKSKFYLLGYSFGVNVALELAALLEKEGQVGVVYCLDSSPETLRAQLDAYLGNLLDIELQIAIVKHMFSLMTGRDSNELDSDLKTTETWLEKVETGIKGIRKYGSYTTEYARSAIKSAYERVLLAKSYEPKFKLKSKIVLMKGIPHPKCERLANDYNLSKFSTQPVQVINIDSDHTSAAEDLKISNIVHNFLDPNLIEEFRKMNLCETYVYNT